MNRLPTAICLALFAAPAYAHLPPGEYGSLAAGFSHPLFGLDHILAMVAVGLWASMLGGLAVWIVPAAFVSVMVAGFGLALSGAHLPLVEPMILASSIALGLLVAMAAKLDLRLGAVLVAFFAIFHGHAHGGELGEAGAAQFGLGFALATAALHCAGIGLGLSIERVSRRLGDAGPFVARGLGGLTALAGLGLAVA
jgi:urease accessory protein